MTADPSSAPAALRPERPAPVRLAEVVPGAPPVAVTGLTLDSRLVRPGDLFVALPSAGRAGTGRHGAGFAPAAVAAGAVAVLTDEAGAGQLGELSAPVVRVADPRGGLGALAAAVYGHPGTRLTTFGLTGTNGKTTTSFLLEAALRRAGWSTGLIGTLGFRLDGRDLAGARTTITTPEAPELQAVLALLVERGARAVVMEVSSHALALGRVEPLRFDVSGFTGFGRDHLEFHGTEAAYFAAKARLFTPEHARRAVVNVDDERGRELADRVRETGATELRTVSRHPDGADYTVLEARDRPDGGTDVRAGTPAGAVAFSVGLPGAFNVRNALLALAMADAGGVDLVRAASGLAAAVVPGRMQRVVLDAPAPSVVVDFAHTPQAVAAVLAGLPGRRRIVVLGCGGDRDPAKRGPMGAAAVAGADVVVVTDDNPRSEDPATIRAAVLSGAYAEQARQRQRGRRVEVRDGGDRRAAIGAALDEAAAADVVAVLGKGHETGQELGGRWLPFDDVAVVRDCWAARLGGARDPLDLARAAELLDAELLAPQPAGSKRPGPITGLAVDSRLVEPGWLFVALPGTRVDGHAFVPEAFRRGAVAAVTAHPVPGTPGPCLVVSDPLLALARLGRDQVDRGVLAGLRVAAVTGSQGKTSTKDLLAAVLEQAGPTVAPYGNLNNEVGLPLTLARLGTDTRFLVAEMGARGVGHIAYLCRIAPPEVGIVLNVGQAHLGEFGSVAAIATAKGELVEALPASGAAVLNADDPRVWGMQTRTAARVVGFGLERRPPADEAVWASGLRPDPHGRCAFRLHGGPGGGDTVEVQLAVSGRHQVPNALAAAATASVFGLPLERIAAALGAAAPRSAGRMELLRRPDGGLVINDAYNANPASMRAAVDTLVQIATAAGDGRTWALLGDMLELGEAADAEHVALGRYVAERGVDRLLVIGEHAAAIAAGAGAGPGRPVVTTVPDRASALDRLRAEVGPADVVLVKASHGLALSTVAEALRGAEPPTSARDQPSQPSGESA